MNRTKKPFKSLYDQVITICKRGMDVPDTEVAEKILLRENYYNVINGYKEIFLNIDCSEETFLDKSNFNEIYRLYDLDRQMRNKLLKYLLIFETNLKTICAYRFSEKYKNDYAYLNIENYSTNSDRLDIILKNIANLSKVIQKEKNKKHNNSIKHYIESHENIPLWVLVNSLTFGEISYFYNSLDESLQDKIAKDFSSDYQLAYKKTTMVTNGDLKEILFVVNLYRNVCAHEEVLYSYNIYKPIKKKHLKKHFEHKKIIECLNQGNMFSVFALLKLVLSNEEYLELINDFSTLFYSMRLTSSFGSVGFDSILSSMGFYCDWEKEVLENENYINSLQSIVNDFEKKEKEKEDAKVSISVPVFFCKD